MSSRLVEFRRPTPETSAPADVAARLRRLERELDQERALLWGAAVIGCIGVTLALAVDRAFAALPALAVVTVAHYAVRGWSPVALLLAGLGLRSSREIDGERHALAASIEDPAMPRLRPTGAD